MAMGKDPKEMGISFHRNKGNQVLGKVDSPPKTMEEEK